MMSDPLINEIFNAEEKQIISIAIKNAELNTSGEIRVHIEKKCKEDVLDHAVYIFDKLGMQNTENRNGILFYLSLSDHKFAVIGDVGINQKVGDEFWEIIKNEMIPLFKENKMVVGLALGIEQAGIELKKYFPYQSDDKNELDDEISFG
jgi:uncharacterized membrane protein